MAEPWGKGESRANCQSYKTTIAAAVCGMSSCSSSICSGPEQWNPGPRTMTQELHATQQLRYSDPNKHTMIFELLHHNPRNSTDIIMSPPTLTSPRSLCTPRQLLSQTINNPFRNVKGSSRRYHVRNPIRTSAVSDSSPNDPVTQIGRREVEYRLRGGRITAPSQCVLRELANRRCRGWGDLQGKCWGW